MVQETKFTLGEGKVSKDFVTHGIKHIRGNFDSS